MGILIVIGVLLLVLLVVFWVYSLIVGGDQVT
jgi:hypothetical protein